MEKDIEEYMGIAGDDARMALMIQLLNELEIKFNALMSEFMNLRSENMKLRYDINQLKMELSLPNGKYATTNSGNISFGDYKDMVNGDYKPIDYKDIVTSGHCVNSQCTICTT